MPRPMDTGSIECRPERALPYTPRLPRAYGRRRLRPCATEAEATTALADELERLADEPPEAVATGDGAAVIALLAEHGALVSRLHALAYAGDWPALVTECERALKRRRHGPGSADTG